MGHEGVDPIEVPAELKTIEASGRTFLAVSPAAELLIRELLDEGEHAQ